MAAIIDWLSSAGHRLSTGEPNASGTLRVLSPGTQSEVPIFDADGETISQPVELDASGRADVFVEGPVDLAFESAEGADVQTMSFGNIHDAGQILVENDAFIGTLASGSQGAGGRTYLASVLSLLGATFGGTDCMVQESDSATPRLLVDVLSGIQLSVKDFGAVGNGVADDTTAVQLAINRCAARGGGVVYLDPGTYLISSPIILSSVNGVSIRGSGSISSILKGSGAASNLMTISSASGMAISDLGLANTGTSTGAAIQLDSCGSALGGLLINNVAIGNYRTGLNLTGTTGFLTVRSTNITTAGGSANDRAIQVNSTNGTITLWAIGNYLNGQIGAAVELSGSSVAHFFIANQISGTTGIAINAAFSGSGVILRNNYFNFNTTPLSVGTATMPSGLRTDTNQNLAGRSVDIVSGGTATPDRARGSFLRIRGTTTGVAYTINAPTPVPTTNSSERELYFTIAFYNNAGIAITGWALDANYHRSANPDTTDGNTTTYVFRWDIDRSIWQEVSRSVSA